MKFSRLLADIILAASIASASVGYGTADSVRLPIDTSKNHIVFPAGNASFAPFLRKLDSLAYTGKGQVNILHLGGSHIQADVITNRIRTNLLKGTSLPAGSRGFVFPFAAARTNSPISYATRKSGHFKGERCVHKDRHEPLGLLGIQVTTIDPDASIGIVLDARTPESRPWRFQRIRVFGFSPDSIEPVLQLDSNGTNFFPRRDSASGSFVFDIPQKADSLAMRFPWKNSIREKALRDTLSKLDSLGQDSIFADTNFFKTQPSFTLTGILLTDSVPGITYNSIGINGANLDAYLSLENLERDLNFSKPDLVVFAIGINDANIEDFDPELFKSHYDSLVGKIRGVSPEAALIFVSNNDAYLTKTNRPNKNGTLVSKACLALAKKYQAGFWDMYAVMGGFRSIESWQAADYAKKDHVHFKNPGYELLGDLFSDALLEVIRPGAPKISRIPKKLPATGKTTPSSKKKSQGKRK